MFESANERPPTIPKDLPSYRPKLLNTQRETQVKYKDSSSGLPVEPIMGESTEIIPNNSAIPNTINDTFPNNNCETPNHATTINPFPGNILLAMPKTGQTEENERNISAEETADGVKFHPSQFILALIVHILYYLLLGPIMILVLLMVYGSNMLGNMGFIAGLDMLFQNLLWLLNLIIMGWLVLYKEDGTWDLAFRAIVLTLVRAIIISLRYGYTSPSTYNDIKDVDLTQNSEIYKEYVLKGLLDIEPMAVENELMAAFKRQHVDSRALAFNFYDKLPQVLYDKLVEDNYYIKHEYDPVKEEEILVRLTNRKERPETSAVHPADTSAVVETDNKSFQMHEKTKQNFVGLRLAREIILHSKLYSGIPKVFAIIAAAHGLVPFIMHLIYVELLDTPLNELIPKIAYAFVSGFLEVMLVMLLLMQGVDFGRKRAALSAMSSLLHPTKKANYYFPRLKVLSPLNSWNWLVLRRVILNFGKRYTLRMYSYSYVFLTFNLLTAILMLLYTFDVCLWQYSREFIFLCVFDLLLFSILLCYVLYNSLKLNQATKTQKKYLQTHRKTLYWMRMVVRYQDTSEEFPYFYNKQLKEFMESHNQGQAIGVLEDIIQILKFAEDEMDVEKELHSVNIWGMEPKGWQLFVVFTIGLMISILAISKYFEVL